MAKLLIRTQLAYSCLVLITRICPYCVTSWLEAKSLNQKNVNFVNIVGTGKGRVENNFRFNWVEYSHPFSGTTVVKVLLRCCTIEILFAG